MDKNRKENNKMTPEQIQIYTRKCAELMGYTIGNLEGWISGKMECAYKKNENGGIYDTKKIDSLNYHSDWREQIPVWQKVSEILYAKLYGMDYLPILFNNAEKIEEDYYEEIRKGAPQSAFEFLCQGIDFIEQFKTEKK